MLASIGEKNASKEKQTSALNKKTNTTFSFFSYSSIKVSFHPLMGAGNRRRNSHLVCAYTLKNAKWRQKRLKEANFQIGCLLLRPNIVIIQWTGKKKSFASCDEKSLPLSDFADYQNNYIKEMTSNQPSYGSLIYFHKPSTLPHRNPLTNVFNHGCISAWWSLPISFDSCPNYAASYCYESPAVMMLFGWKMRCWHTKFLCNFI